jgi:hypothetical protein
MTHLSRPSSVKPICEADLLFSDIKRHNMNGLMQLLDRRPNLDQTYGRAGYPFIAAVKAGYIDCLGLLIKCGADVNVNMDGTGLHYAVKEQMHEVLDFLLESDADVGAVDENGDSALFHAVRALDKESAEKLIDHGCSLSSISGTGDTCLTTAIATKDYAIVKFLLDKGADPNSLGKHPLGVARELKVPVIEQLLVMRGAKELPRRPRCSRLQQRQGQQRSQSVLERQNLESRRKDGRCYICGETSDLLKLVPCGHPVVCEKCLDVYCHGNQKCTTCHLAFFATKRV